MTNKRNNVLYVGVTNNLVRRISEHKKELPGSSKFCMKYNINKLVYYEYYDSWADAIDREKQLKAGNRKRN